MSKTTSDDQGISTEMQKLCDEVLADKQWGSHLRQLECTLDAFDPGIAEELDLNTAESKKLCNIVRYCIPLFEMHYAIDGAEIDPGWFAAMYLWQEAWRPLDNLLDDDGPLLANLREYNISLLRAWTFQSHAFPNNKLMEQFLRCLNDTLEIEANYEERKNPSLIYRRVSLYEVVFDGLHGLSDETKTNFHTYINAIGIAHDFGDVVSDIKSGTDTFATEALRTIDPHCRLTLSHYQRLKEECQMAFRGQIAILDRATLESCWVTQRNIDTFFRWAFGG